MKCADKIIIAYIIMLCLLSMFQLYDPNTSCLVKLVIGC